MEQEKWDKLHKELDDALETAFEPNHETLEEAALSFLPHSEVEHDTDFITGFEFGAKWQSKRMYSEEEVYDILFKHTEYFLGGGERMSLTQWFEQFKKK